MIDLYTWSTPNGRKVSILLEELGVPYEVHSVNIETGEQHDPAFLKVSPNNKIPAIYDRDTGLSLMESGAIMVYLAEKHGRFLPKDPLARAQVMQWLMWQMGGFGPMLGQSHHFLYPKRGKSEYAEERYAREAKRLYAVLDRQLALGDWVSGDYSIADMAIFPWAARHPRQEIDLASYPNVARWYRVMQDRPPVQRGYIVPDDGDALPRI
ncbi:glutathione S-transferase N-terminal domain-containing protein [Fluviibacterium sp. DFM31]|uniref:Glutathione S-transferase N-terminal domain-containing protein n=1 Tax=Meridianimarinicoccus marinus TaxID=3231483 RepID=A0ABV3L6K0_9RHOB